MSAYVNVHANRNLSYRLQILLLRSRPHTTTVALTIACRRTRMPWHFYHYWSGMRMGATYVCSQRSAAVLYAVRSAVVWAMGMIGVGWHVM